MRSAGIWMTGCPFNGMTNKVRLIGGVSMDLRLPIQVGLMDDDFFAMKWNANLISRDLRTTLCFEAETPRQLLALINSNPEIDVVLLDVEYQPVKPDLLALISAIKATSSKPAVVCLAQYGCPASLQAAIQSGARGYLKKQEIRMEIVSALLMALHVDFLVTPEVFKLVDIWEPLLLKKVQAIKPWEPNPSMTSKLERIFTLRVLYGMSAPSAAREIYLAPGTIEKYMHFAYQSLDRSWADESYLMGLELGEYPQEVRAFHRYVLPPKSENNKTVRNDCFKMCNNGY
jgi:DNA-binding NarL/FixJ family response regulator